MDTQFLDTGTDAGVGKADEFTGPLWKSWKNIPEHDVVRVSLWIFSCFVWGSGDNTYPLHLSLFGLDYLLHASGDRLSLKQVKFNAILSSSLLGSLSERVAAMHTSHSCIYTRRFIPVYITISDLPENNTTSGFTKGCSCTP
jgi:glutathione synthase